METVKLVSGGIDSYIMSQEYDGLNVYIDFGQKYADFEKHALDKLQVPYEIIDIKSSFKETDIYIPNRNLTFASLITTIYNPHTIMIAGLKDDNCIDKNINAFENMSRILSDYTDHPVTVYSPYSFITKGQLIQNFKDKEKLVHTFSCYNPNKNGTPCGNCPACLRKAVALDTNGIDCGFNLSETIINEYLSKIHQYDSDRISRFFFYLNKRAPVHAFDMDGIICEERGPFNTRKPILQNIEKINQTNGYIIIYTARLESDRYITIKWLNEHNVHYDALIMNKLPYNTLIDDRAFNYLK